MHNCYEVFLIWQTNVANHRWHPSVLRLTNTDRPKCWIENKKRFGTSAKRKSNIQQTILIEFSAPAGDFNNNTELKIEKHSQSNFYYASLFVLQFVYIREVDVAITDRTILSAHHEIGFSSQIRWKITWNVGSWAAANIYSHSPNNGSTEIWIDHKTTNENRIPYTQNITRWNAFPFSTEYTIETDFDVVILSSTSANSSDSDWKFSSNICFG